MSSGSSSSNTLHNVQCGYGVRAPLRTTLTEPNMGRRFLGYVNYKGDKACKFFEWIDSRPCERGKDFGNWVVMKNMDLEKQIAELKVKIKEFKERKNVKMEECNKREEWFVVKMNCMKRSLKEMEDELELKMEECKNKKDSNELEMEDLRVKMKEAEATNVALRLKVQEVGATNVALG